MRTYPSYLEQRRFERRWRVVTALVIAGALAAAAVWTLERHAAGPAVTADTHVQNRK